MGDSIQQYSKLEISALFAAADASLVNADPQPCLRFEALLLTMANTKLAWHTQVRGNCSKA